jgi:hypothetical protein
MKSDENITLKFMVALVSNIEASSLPDDEKELQKIADKIGDFSEILNSRYMDYVKFLENLR